MDVWVAEALAFGFCHAAPLSRDALVARAEVRDMCADGRCRLYGRSWMCPPACGTIEDCAGRLRGYRGGLIVQTTGAMEDDFDYEAIRDAEVTQKRLFAGFADVLRQRHPGLLALGSGGCELCGRCTYPDAPCRYPDKAVSSMEAFGLLVNDVCRASGIDYYYGPRTITYTGCYLWE